jgi:hypothetical protein
MATSHQISKLRFDSLAGYIRKLFSYAISEEISWHEHTDGRVLGTVIRDRVDDDFGGIVFGRDRQGRFRCIDVTNFSVDPLIAQNQLLASMDEWSKRSPEAFYQDDEKGQTVDFFTPVVYAHKLNAAFCQLAGTEGFSPARALIEAMMYYYEDVDGNFVEQFQSSGFDARFWELYLFALLTEEKFTFDRTYTAPDFACTGLLQDIFVEAVTVNPTRIGNLVTEPLVPADSAGTQDYLTQYMPIKWAGTLTAKLDKEYWKLPGCAGKPLVFAVQDFHVQRAMTFTTSTLLPYLYGRAFNALYDDKGNLHVSSFRISSHTWGAKTIKSGFFYLPNAKMVSAVIQNPIATISKFNRMGRLAKMGSPTVKMLRVGTAYNPDPNSSVPTKYVRDVDAPNYTEKWCEGLNVYHNPFAVYPLAPGLFPGAMHHRLKGENIVHSIPEFHPYSAETMIFSPQRVRQRSLGGFPLYLHQERT